MTVLASLAFMTSCGSLLFLLTMGDPSTAGQTCPETDNCPRGGSGGHALLQTRSQRSKIAIQTDTTLNHRATTPALGRVWPEGRIPYWIDDVNDEDDAASAGYSGVFSSTNIAILSGIANIEAKTCLRFHQCDTREECNALGSFIRFRHSFQPTYRATGRGSACHAHLGMGSGEIVVALPDWCLRCSSTKACPGPNCAESWANCEGNFETVTDDDGIEWYTGGVEHEVGHTLTMMHTSDRSAGVRQEESMWYRTNAAGSGVDIGPFNEGDGSIQFGAGRFTQRDVEFIEFMYGNCKNDALDACTSTVDDFTPPPKAGRDYPLEFAVRSRGTPAENIDIQILGASSARTQIHRHSGWMNYAGVRLDIPFGKSSIGSTITVTAKFSTNTDSFNCSVELSPVDPCSGVDCANGVCQWPGACLCEEGWAGETCASPISFYERYEPLKQGYYCSDYGYRGNRHHNVDMEGAAKMCDEDEDCAGIAQWQCGSGGWNLCGYPNAGQEFSTNWHGQQCASAKLTSDGAAELTAMTELNAERCAIPALVDKSSHQSNGLFMCSGIGTPNSCFNCANGGVRWMCVDCFAACGQDPCARLDEVMDTKYIYKQGHCTTYGYNMNVGSDLSVAQLMCAHDARCAAVGDWTCNGDYLLCGADGYQFTTMYGTGHCLREKSQSEGEPMVWTGPCSEFDDFGESFCINFGCSWTDGLCSDTPGTPEPTSSSTAADTLASCCKIVSEHGVVPHSTWGSTPHEKRTWWSANDCDTVVGGSSTANCNAPTVAPVAMPTTLPTRNPTAAPTALSYELYKAAVGCGSQHRNLGEIEKPELCAQQVVAFKGCGPQFMFSAYTSWGCRCCAVDGADGGHPNANWNLYTATGWEPAPTELPTSSPTHAPTEVPTKSPTSSPTDASTEAPTEASTSSPTEALSYELYKAAVGCGSQYRNLGEIEKPELCAQQVVAFKGCGPQFMFSAYTSWGCRCCAVDGADGGHLNANWNLYTATGWEPAPIELPTSSPTHAPTEVPTKSPTSSPTDASTEAPTEASTSSPTEALPTRTPTAAPTTTDVTKPCKSFCATNKKGWKIKCGWKPCNGCPNCYTPSAPPAVACKASCAKNAKGWNVKCKWKTCKGCSECDAASPSPPASGVCKASCAANKKKEWNEKCLWKNCKGCPACLHLSL